MPFLVLALATTHLIALHDQGSGNPLGARSSHYFVPLHPLYGLKDLFGFLIVAAAALSLVAYRPNLLLHPDNYSVASPLTTPSHIVPEWYFLPYYAILRSVPLK